MCLPFLVLCVVFPVGLLSIAGLFRQLHRLLALPPSPFASSYLPFRALPWCLSDDTQPDGSGSGGDDNTSTLGHMFGGARGRKLRPRSALGAPPSATDDQEGDKDKGNGGEDDDKGGDGRGLGEYDEWGFAAKGQRLSISPQKAQKGTRL